MLTENQLLLIREYLSSRKLSMDILIEVNDHFITQIQHLMSDHGLSFEEAFDQTKSSWLKDLSVVYDVRYGFEDSNQLMNQRRKSFYLQSFADHLWITFAVLITFILPAYYFSHEAYAYLIVALWLVLLSVPIFYYFFYYAFFKSVRNQNREGVKVSVLDGIEILGISGLGGGIAWSVNLYRYASEVQEFLWGNFSWMGFIQIVLIVIVAFYIRCIVLLMKTHKDILLNIKTI